MGSGDHYPHISIIFSMDEASDNTQWEVAMIQRVSYLFFCGSRTIPNGKWRSLPRMKRSF